MGLMLLTGCSSLFYYPSRQMFSDPRQNGFEYEKVIFSSSDGTKLSGWFFPSDGKVKCKGTIIQFHGNAENMSTHYVLYSWVTRHGYNFFTFDYRGYGESAGTPDQEGLNGDAVAAVEYVKSRVSSDPTGHRKDIVLVGQSLGGAVVLRAVTDLKDRSRIRAVIAESTFSNYKRIARRVLAAHWVTYIFQPLAYVLISNSYAPEDHIKSISPIPILVIHGTQDGTVGIENGEEIFEAANEPKTFWRIEGAGHIEAMVFDEGRYREKLLTFLDGLQTK